MFKDKVFEEYNAIVPARVFEIKSEQDYDGFEFLCGGHIQYNIHIPSHFAENKYNDLIINCDNEDDSYCMLKNKECEHKRKIGYIKTGEFSRLYPKIGEYVVLMNNKAMVITKEVLDKNFIKKGD